VTKYKVGPAIPIFAWRH